MMFRQRETRNQKRATRSMQRETLHVKPETQVLIQALDFLMRGFIS